MKVKTKADLKRLPVGTRLRLTHCLMGPTDKLRTIHQVRSNDILFRTEDNQLSYLTLGGKLNPLENGFELLENNEVAARYEFA